MHPYISPCDNKMFSKFSFILLLIFTTFPTKAINEPKTYIVHLTSSPQSQHFSHHQLQQHYYNLFFSKTFSSKRKPRIIHTYRHAITGFAAEMSADEANSLQNMTGVVSVRPETHFRLHTTHSPQFLGLRHDSGLWKDSNYGKGIIIGVLDTGITPRHPSFHDSGLPPPPARWKGRCEVVPGIRCNNKLIGMRNFVNTTSPIDEQGHGTHTSSTAAGNFVDNANIFGNLNGTSTGMAPLAHLAMYKVCNREYCSESNSIAGMDAAIEDGVDVLSISFGGSSVPFYKDSMGISAFSAIKKGIFVTCSAGNSGPSMATLSNEVPWVLTVGASTIDRRIRTTVYLGNKKLLDGESLYQPKNLNLHQKLIPLVYPGQNGNYSTATCSSGSLYDVKGKVVVCDMGGMIGTVAKGKVVKDAGGAAMILRNGIVCPEFTVPEAHVLPASNVGYKEGIEIKNYLNNNSSPVATIIQRGTVIGVKSAPEVACFSSRGPNLASPGILKPDIIGPGVDILAAYWPITFEILSGTSMSCPHLAGVAALLKTKHPKWSPAAIKSAMMTSASRVSLYGKPIVDEREDVPADMFATGAGHVDPAKAQHPGLVFDIQPDDYIPYLCGLGYTTEQIKMIVKKHEPFYCMKRITESELNYPSIVVELLKRGESKTCSRTVTNVGIANSIYTIGNVSVPEGVRMVVDIKRLRFKAIHQKLKYRITFTRDMTMDCNKMKLGTYGQGYMTWVSGKYSVTTPFLFKFGSN